MGNRHQGCFNSQWEASVQMRASCRWTRMWPRAPLDLATQNLGIASRPHSCPCCPVLDTALLPTPPQFPLLPQRATLSSSQTCLQTTKTSSTTPQGGPCCVTPTLEFEMQCRVTRKHGVVKWWVPWRGCLGQVQHHHLLVM